MELIGVIGGIAIFIFLMGLNIWLSRSKRVKEWRQKFWEKRTKKETDLCFLFTLFFIITASAWIWVAIHPILGVLLGVVALAYPLYKWRLIRALKDKGS